MKGNNTKTRHWTLRYLVHGGEKKDLYPSFSLYVYIPGVSKNLHTLPKKLAYDFFNGSGLICLRKKKILVKKEHILNETFKDRAILARSIMKIGICAIIKDIYKPYLEEWLHYHEDRGVDYFFIYDNESTIPIRKVVNDSVYITEFPGKCVQLQAYNQCIRDIKSGVLPFCDWLAFIDEDEFIVSENDDLKQTLVQYNGYSAIGINWRLFGSSGLRKKTHTSQRKKFIYHTSVDYDLNRHIKTIVDPFKTISTGDNPHFFIFSEGSCVDVHKNPIIGYLSEKPIYQNMWIDHYYTRSLEDWKEKIAKGRPDSLEPRKFWRFAEVNNHCTECIPWGRTKKFFSLDFIRQWIL